MRWPFSRMTPRSPLDRPPVEYACYACGSCGWGGQMAFNGRPPEIAQCPQCFRPSARKTC